MKLNNMNIIYVGFSKPKSWKIFAQLIMFGYGIPYDHVYIRYFSKEMNNWMIFQASKTNVNMMSQATLEQDNFIVKEFEVQLTNENMAAMQEFASSSLGRPYGIKECFGLAWVRVCALFGKVVSNPFKFTGSTYVCSELAGYVCEQFAGMDVDIDPANINPKEMYDYLSSKLVNNKIV